MGTNLVEEMSVMADNDNGVFEIHKEFLEPCDSRNIKVVGRLVKKKDIGIAEKSLSKKHLNLLLTCELTHKAVMEFVVDTESIKKNFCITFCAPAVHLGEFLFELTDSDAVLLGEFLLGVKLFLCIHNFNELGVTHKHGTDYIVLVISIMVLL